MSDKPEYKLREKLAPFVKANFQEEAHRHPDTDTVEPFPIEVFEGTQIGRLAAECKRVYGVPESLTSLTAIGVLSAACGANYKIVDAASGHTSLPNLYIVLVAESGTGKSAVFKQLAKPIVDASAELQEKSNLERVNRETRADLLRDERKRIQKKINSELSKTLEKGTPEYGEMEDSLIEINLELQEIENFQSPTYYVQNTTSEALARSLEASDGYMSILSDEGAEIIKVAMGKYSKSGGDVSILTNGWSSGPLQYDRIGRERISLSSATLSIMLMIQPDVMEEFLTHRETLEQGLLARFIAANTQAKPQMRNGELLEFDENLSTDWDRFIRCILSAREGESETTVSCSPEAREAFDRFYNETVTRRENETSMMRPIFARWSENAIRVALLLHILEGSQGELSKEIAERSIKLVRWCGDQVDGLLDYARAKSLATKRERMVEIISAKGNVRKRDLARGCSATAKEIEELAQSETGVMLWECRSESGNMIKWIGFNPPREAENIQYQSE